MASNEDTFIIYVQVTDRTFLSTDGRAELTVLQISDFFQINHPQTIFFYKFTSKIPHIWQPVLSHLDPCCSSKAQGPSAACPKLKDPLLLVQSSRNADWCFRAQTSGHADRALRAYMAYLRGLRSVADDLRPRGSYTYATRARFAWPKVWE